MKQTLYSLALFGLLLLVSLASSAVAAPIRGARAVPRKLQDKDDKKDKDDKDDKDKKDKDDKKEGRVEKDKQDEGAGGSAGAAGEEGNVRGSPADCDLEGHLQTQDLSFDAQETERLAQLVALETSGELVAPPETVEKIESDLTVIRKTYGQMNSVDHNSLWIPGEIIVVFTPDAQEEILAGTYSFSDLDAVASRYGDFTMEGSVYKFATPYHPELLAEEFNKANIPGVSDVTPNMVVGGSDRILVQESTGGATVYRFEIGYGDCIASCSCKDYWEFHVKEDENGDMVSPLMESSTDIIPLSMDAVCDVDAHFESADLRFNANSNREEAELVALEASGDLKAPASLVNQIEQDLEDIRKAFPNMNAVTHSAPWNVGEIVVQFDDDAAQKVEAGTYNFNQLKAVTGSFGGTTEQQGNGQIIYKFDEPYHPERISNAVLEARAPGVESVTPVFVTGDFDKIVLKDTAPVPVYEFQMKYGDNCEVQCTCGEFFMYEITKDGPVLVDSGNMDSMGTKGGSSANSFMTTFAILPFSLLVSAVLGLIV